MITIDEKNKVIKLDDQTTIDEFFRFARETNFNYSNYTIKMVVEVQKETKQCINDLKILLNEGNKNK